MASVSHQLDERQNDLVSQLIAVQKAPKIGRGGLNEPKRYGPYIGRM